jgi:poly-beta-1,6-N-acetyl-D-glucosamine synthase
MLIETLTIINWFILLYFILLGSGYLVLLVSSISDVYMRFREVAVGDIISLMKSNSLPPITVILPAYNEESHILESLASVLNSYYPNVFIIVVNDGSTDQTLKKLIEEFDLEKIDFSIQPQIKVIGHIKAYYLSKFNQNVMVIDKEHTDKSDTLNVGVNACRTPLFTTIDADTLVEPDAISRIAFYMLSHPHTIAVGGSVYILNGCQFMNGKILEAKMSKKPIYSFQVCEYLRSFTFSRSGWNALHGALCYAGTFTLFEHKAVIEIGGFDVGNLAQDFEIITHLHADIREKKNPYHVGYTAAPVVWTDVPGTLKSYWRQRYNWQYYTLQSLAPYTRMLFNPKYGITGLFTYPFFLFGETLGALVEFVAYLSILMSWYLGIIHGEMVLLFILIAWGFLIFLTMATALINFVTFNQYRKLTDLPWFLFFSAIEIFGFRQFNLLCRVKATIDYFFDKLHVYMKRAFGKGLFYGKN